MKDHDPRAAHEAPEAAEGPTHPTGINPATPGIHPATEDVIAPPDDDQLHSDLGLVSGGAGEEGNARAHQDG